jgi:hypothetical protein
VLYRTLVFTNSKRLLDGFPFLNQGIFERLVRTKPALLRDTVRNVMVHYERYVYEAEVADIVQAFPGIENMNFAVTVNTS